MRKIALLRSPEPLQCALIATCCALAVLLLAPPAQDLAAHVYRATLVDQGVVLWDNYSTIHRGIFDFGQSHRLMHRVSFHDGWRPA